MSDFNWDASPSWFTRWTPNKPIPIAPFPFEALLTSVVRTLASGEPDAKKRVMRQLRRIAARHGTRGRRGAQVVT